MTSLFGSYTGGSSSVMGLATFLMDMMMQFADQIGPAMGQIAAASAQSILFG